MSAYVLGQLTIHDRDTYAKYEAGFMEVLDQYKGEILSVDEAPNALEGQWKADRSVILQFPDYEAALGWYQSDAYQAIAKHRHAASIGNILLVNGPS
ncbi:DUF1330 domain-containing protein [Alphaproteobacteria bacterium]|nr:DUF1330 domain-containing protein [Alphaproteobacteria bacterium]MDC0131876.1 DUF1330 domain-containing protein [Alphaproteobacteria bacterium]